MRLETNMNLIHTCIVLYKETDLYFICMFLLHSSFLLVKFILKGILDLGKSRLVLLLQVFSGVLDLGHVGVGEAQTQCFKFAGFFDLLDIKARCRMWL